MNRIKFVLLCMWFACSVFSVPTASAQVAATKQGAYTNRMTDLRATADESSAVIRSLPKDTPVQVLLRRGGWHQVKVADKTGWVKMFHVTGASTVVEAEKGGAGSSALASFTRFLTGGGDSSRGNQRAQSATLGIRGFSKEDVAKADFNPAEFEKLKRYQVADADAQRFANQGKLAFRSVAYLAEDAVEASTGGRK